MCGCSRRTRSMAPAQPRQCTPRSSNALWRGEVWWASVFAVPSGSILATAATPLERFDLFACTSCSFRRSGRLGRLRPEGSPGPHPLANLGRVLQVLPGVGRGPGDQTLKLGDQGWSAVLLLARGASQGLRGQVVAAHSIEDDHIEGCRGGALLFEAAHVEAVDVYVAVHDLVDRTLVAVKGEDYRLVSGKQLDEAGLAHAVRVELAREERHEDHDVDYPHLELGRILAQPVR